MNERVQAIMEAFCVGTAVSFTKTLSESDVYMFAGITGDLAPNHVNEEYMRKTEFGSRVVHGVLVLGLASTTTWIFATKFNAPGVSLGYDKVRFLKPVYFGDTITIDYTICELDLERARVYATVRGTNQKGDQVLSAIHIIKIVPNDN